MNCFVIMPFSVDFDDVYDVIKVNVEEALSTAGGRCFRLDEARPAGRITDRLLTELKAASMCVADLTGTTPNVMWEVGYAMAMNKPTLIVTQNSQELPFDLKDMQAIKYSRARLGKTLGEPLRRMVIDTVAAMQTADAPDRPVPNPSDEVIAGLRDELGDMKNMIAQAVRFLIPETPRHEPIKDEANHLKSVEGAWLNGETGSHIYASMVNGDLVAPYCYEGNDLLTGVYYGWRMVGEYWFARFVWLDRAVSGFSFLKQESPDLITGAWWNDYDVEEVNPAAPPPMKSGVPATLKRRKHVTRFPEWATKFIDEVREEGLQRRLMRGVGE